LALLRESAPLKLLGSAPDPDVRMTSAADRARCGPLGPSGSLAETLIGAARLRRRRDWKRRTPPV